MKLAAIALFAASLFAQQPAVENAKFAARPFSGSLAMQFSQLGAGPYWAGYAEPAASRRSGDGCANASIHLEGQTALVVLVRIDRGAVDQLRIISPDCKVDAGGLPFYWIENVPAAASVDWLKSRIDDQQVDRILSAIAMHIGPEASQVLIDAARNGKTAHIRGQSLFWLAQRAGDKQAAEVINNAALNDPDRSVKERAVFALRQLPADQGIPLLIALAKTNSDPNVRKKAMFWLGQSKEPRALEFFAQVLKQ